MAEGFNLSAIQSLSDHLSKTASEDKDATEKVYALSLDKVKKGKFQPRTIFDEDEIEKLAESIKAQGVLQPIIVRPLPDSDEFELIGGERRCIASRKVGLEVIPAIIREYDDLEAQAASLIDNIDRENISLYDESIAVAKMVDERGAAATSKVLGKSKTWIAKRRKIGSAPDLILEFLSSNYSTDVESFYELTKLYNEEDTREAVIELLAEWDANPAVRTGLRAQVNALKALQNEEEVSSSTSIDIGGSGLEGIDVSIDSEGDSENQISFSQDDSGFDIGGYQEVIGAASDDFEKEAILPPMEMEESEFDAGNKTIKIVTSDGPFVIKIKDKQSLRSLESAIKAIKKALSE